MADEFEANELKPDEHYVKASVLNVSFSNVGFLVFLKKDGEETALPICIGAAEVNSISAALSKQEFPRPLTHDLFKSVLTDLNCTLNKVLITELRDNTFYARLFMTKEGKEIEFDARPSDAISLALRFNTPIFVHEAVFEEAGVPITEESEGEEKKKKSPLDHLKESLEKAVREERYEEAASIKKKIQQMELDDLMNN